MNDAIKAKLQPTRFSDMSPLMAALVGHLVMESFTDPQIIAVSITSDGFVLAATNKNPLFDLFLGSFSEVKRNFQELFKAAELTPEELSIVERDFKYRFGEHHEY